MKFSVPALSALLLISTPAIADKQSDRKGFIEELTNEGYFQKLDTSGPVARLWVTPAFKALDFNTKSQFVNVVFAYISSRTDQQKLVVIIDSITGKPIGRYSPEYAGLEMD